MGKWEDEHFLASVGPGDGEAQVTVRAVRPVVEDEWTRLVDAAAVVARFRPVPMFADLRDAYERLRETIARTEQGILASAELSRDEMRRLEATVRDWLAQLGAFEDHTMAAVGEYFAKEDKQRVRAAFSAEYDANLAYRLGCALRNASLHQGRVLNGVSLTTSEIEPKVEYFLGFDLPRLAEDAPRLPARIRREMTSIEQRLALLPVVDNAMVACERIMARVLAIVHDRLQEESRFIHQLHVEAVGDADEDSALFAVTLDGERIVSMTRTNIPGRIGELIRETHAECVRVLTHDHEVTSGDLT